MAKILWQKIWQKILWQKIIWQKIIAKNNMAKNNMAKNIMAKNIMAKKSSYTTIKLSDNKICHTQNSLPISVSASYVYYHVIT